MLGAPGFSVDRPRIATARHQPALARAIFTGKQLTKNPRVGNAPRFASFSIWKYSWSMPTRWAYHNKERSPLAANSRATYGLPRSSPGASVPITLIPCSISHLVAAAPRPGYSSQ